MIISGADLEDFTYIYRKCVDMQPAIQGAVSSGYAANVTQWQS